MTNVEEQEILDVAYSNSRQIYLMLASINIHKSDLDAINRAYLKSYLERHGVDLEPGKHT